MVSPIPQRFRKLLLLLATLLSACFPGPGIGHEGEPCSEEGACLDGLTCVQGVCRAKGEGEDEGKG